jgi:hypothetical protein
VHAKPTPEQKINASGTIKRRGDGSALPEARPRPSTMMMVGWQKKSGEKREKEKTEERTYLQARASPTPFEGGLSLPRRPRECGRTPQSWCPARKTGPLPKPRPSRSSLRAGTHQPLPCLALQRSLVGLRGTGVFFFWGGVGRQRLYVSEIESGRLFEE